MHGLEYRRIDEFVDGVDSFVNATKVYKYNTANLWDDEFVYIPMCWQ